MTWICSFKGLGSFRVPLRGWVLSGQQSLHWEDMLAPPIPEMAVFPGCPKLAQRKPLRLMILFIFWIQIGHDKGKIHLALEVTSDPTFKNIQHLGFSHKCIPIWFSVFNLITYSVTKKETPSIRIPTPNKFSFDSDWHSLSIKQYLVGWWMVDDKGWAEKWIPIWEMILPRSLASSFSLFYVFSVSKTQNKQIDI